MTDEEKKTMSYFRRRIANKKTAYINMYFKIEKMELLLNLIEKQEKVIGKIKDYCNNDLSFERRLKRDKREPDLFNQGRFYTCQNIKDIINGKVENNEL